MKALELTQGYFALLDDEDYERVKAAGPWRSEIDRRKDESIRNVYAKRDLHTKEGKRKGQQKLHRFLLGIEDTKQQVDHFPDPNGLNNQKCNLRVATNAENSRNRRLGNNNSSGYKGVHWLKSAEKCRAQICVNGAKIYLGLFFVK